MDTLAPLLGNDVTPLRAVVPVVRRRLEPFEGQVWESSLEGLP